MSQLEDAKKKRKHRNMGKCDQLMNRFSFEQGWLRRWRAFHLGQLQSEFGPKTVPDPRLLLKLNRKIPQKSTFTCTRFRGVAGTDSVLNSIDLNFYGFFFPALKSLIKRLNLFFTVSLLSVGWLLYQREFYDILRNLIYICMHEFTRKLASHQPPPACKCETISVVT